MKSRSRASGRSPLALRRDFLRVGFAGAAGLALGADAVPCSSPLAQAEKAAAAGDSPRKATNFEVACTTLPYAPFPLGRALQGIQSAGYRYVAWATAHKEASGKTTPILGADAPPDRAKELGKRCRDMGLEPVLMWSSVYPEAPEGLKVLRARIEQAAAGGVRQVLTFGHTKGGDRRLWVERLKELGPLARERGVLLVVKQHGGETGTGEACAAITREVADAGVKVCYDAGNVLDYLDVDPLPDLHKCADEVRSFCIKDHRNFPKDQDCGPGFGEIDHYKLLAQVAFTGLTIPLCCENIFAPLLPRPSDVSEIDRLARRAREFLEVVIAGLQQGG